MGALRLPFVVLLTLSMVVGFGAPDAAQDREECAEQLGGLATCLPYVGAQAKAPTPDCCAGLKTLLNNSKKCLCVIVRDRDDPDLGLNINATLALGLPSVCHAPANVSQCPALLHLAPNSTEAQVFYQFGHTTSSNQTDSSANSTSSNGQATSTSDGCRSSERWFGLETVAAAAAGVMLVFWSFAEHLII